MRKIALYINSLGYGGAERVINNLATKLSEDDNEVILITSYKSEKEYMCGKCVRRVNIKNNHIKNFIKRNIVLVYGLRRFIKTEKPDILISFMAEPNYRAIIASRLLSCKVIVSVRNDPNREYPNILKRVFAKTLFKQADGIVFQTEDAKKWFPNAIQKKSKIIFNQVDNVFFDAKFDGERHDIVSVGRLEKQKNHKMLIKAFAAIANKTSDNLIIYGEGNLRYELETLISELNMQNRILLPGRIDNVAEVIKSAKLFVLSSDYEGMPNSLMEAMVLGIPCISTDCSCGGPKMLFGDLLADRLCTCGDEKELSDKMESVINQNIDGISEKYLSKQFYPEIVFNSWSEYITKICGKTEIKS